jgi:hypothetical protein
MNNKFVEQDNNNVIKISDVENNKKSNLNSNHLFLYLKKIK